MFIDTNVFVYSRFLHAPNHEAARERLGSVLSGHEPLRISRQVTREYLSVVTRPQTWTTAITPEDAIDDAGRLIA